MSLRVRHLAVVEDVELMFTHGMTSLTGETGAGKSILVDAIGLVLGDRADPAIVRHDCKRAEIEATFDTAQNLALTQWLIEQELDDDKQCHCRRTISAEGRSRGYINGRPVPLNQLGELGRHTIDIHSQHAHQSWVLSETQRHLLDATADTHSLLTQLSSAYKAYLTLQNQLNSAQTTFKQQAAQLNLLRYQVEELSSFNLTKNHIDDLISDQKQLAHATTLIDVAESVSHKIFEKDERAAYSLVSQALNSLKKLHEVEPQFSNMIELLDSIIIQLDECHHELRHYLENTHFDPARLNEIDTNLSQLHDLARKHHVQIEALPDLYQTLCKQLSSLENNHLLDEKLKEQLDKQQTLCQNLCKKISKKRQQAAAPLAKKITHAMRQLAMPEGQVEWVINAMPNDKFDETGADNIQLLVSTNSGQTMGELDKIASGGELSRISLAIQVATAESRTVPTLIFDEVDVGIGGRVAEIVGHHLRTLANNQQIICVTHLPQVAVQAHRQNQVSKKHSADKNTYIEVNHLNKADRIEEIARMLGGVTITEKTRAHAKEMLNNAQH